MIRLPALCRNCDVDSRVRYLTPLCNIEYETWQEL